MNLIMSRATDQARQFLLQVRSDIQRDCDSHDDAPLILCFINGWKLGPADQLKDVPGKLDSDPGNEHAVNIERLRERSIPRKSAHGFPQRCIAEATSVIAALSKNPINFKKLTMLSIPRCDAACVQLCDAMSRAIRLSAGVAA